MNNFFNSFFINLRAKKGLFVLLLLLSVLVGVLAVVCAVQLNGSMLPLDLSNIAFIKFLQGNCGFFFLLLGTLTNLLLFYIIIFLFCSKKFLIPLAILFYLYFVYSQVMIFVSILLIYGLFNCLILLLFLLIYYLIIFFLLMLMIIELYSVCGEGFIQNCFNKNECKLLYVTLAIILISVLFCVIITILKAFVILLVY